MFKMFVEQRAVMFGAKLARKLARERENARMNKIPTLFKRDPDNPRQLLREVHPDCQWVIDGEGAPTRKYDGTCVMFDGERWWTRREVKPGKPAPDGFVEVEHDPNTGKTVGWEPAEQSGFWKILEETIARMSIPGTVWKTGTMELYGPKINGNPEDAGAHLLIMHESADPQYEVPRDYDGLAEYLRDFPHEGIVWHHPDGRMAKIKVRDFV